MLSLRCLHSWILITVFLLFQLVIFCHSFSCALGTVWEKISKGEVLKMLLDLKHTKKMPRTGTENEKTPGFSCVVYSAFEVLFGTLAWLLEKKRMLLDFIILEKVWNFLRKEEYNLKL